MPAELPIACTLAATDLRDRLAEIRAIGAAALLEVDRRGAGVVLRFRRNDSTRARLAAIVAAEAQCCAFLDLQLSEDYAALALHIRGPAGAEPVVDDLVAAFAGGQQPA